MEKAFHQLLKKTFVEQAMLYFDIGIYNDFQPHIWLYRFVYENRRFNYQSLTELPKR